MEDFLEYSTVFGGFPKSFEGIFDSDGCFNACPVNLHQLLPPSKPTNLPSKPLTNLLEFSPQSHKSAWPFIDPVDASEVPDYYNVITEPMGKPSSSENSKASENPKKTKFNQVQIENEVEKKKEIKSFSNAGHDRSLIESEKQ
jgi:hypothetical protein